LKEQPNDKAAEFGGKAHGIYLVIVEYEPTSDSESVENR
jgi:hypothetical protein